MCRTNKGVTFPTSHINILSTLTLIKVYWGQCSEHNGGSAAYLQIIFVQVCCTRLIGIVK